MRAWAAGLVLVLGMVGCASPGPPRAPSLKLPQVVGDLAVQREGDEVKVRFTVPQRTTDGLPIREDRVRATLCRGVEGSPCVPVGALKDIGLSMAAGAAGAAGSPGLVAAAGEGPAERTVRWVDRLPRAATTGEPRVLEYRVELANEEGRTAGWSDAAYTAEGGAPGAVEGLHARETREGILLQWEPAGDSARDQVILRREEVAPKAATKSGAKGGSKKEESVWLESHAGGAGDVTVDASAAEDTEYRYVAVRRRVETIGARTIEVRSAESQPVEITWLNRFPPAAPAGLSAAPYAEGGQVAVDLVWEPVEEAGLKGYVVTRQAVDASGAVVGEPDGLGTVTIPAFHDGTARGGVRYRYEVRAVSKKGVEGAGATVVVSAPGSGDRR